MNLEPNSKAERTIAASKWAFGLPLPETDQLLPSAARHLKIDFAPVATELGEDLCDRQLPLSSKFEVLLLDVLVRFINLPTQEIDLEMQNALERVCTILSLERSELWSKSGKAATGFKLTHKFGRSIANGASARNGSANGHGHNGSGAGPGGALSLGAESANALPWITEQAKRGRTTVFANLDELPVEAGPDKQALAGKGVKSGVIIPFLADSEVLGLVGFYMLRFERAWPAPLIRKLELIAEVFANATARKESEALLRESEARFRIAADSAPVLIWMAGTDKRCNFFNRPWLKFTGRSAEQEMGNGWAEGVHPEDLASCMETYTKAFDARECFSMRYRLKRHDGQYRWLLDNGVPRYESDGTFAGYIGSCIDVTDQTVAEEALTKSYAEIKQLKDKLQVETDYLKSEFKTSHAHGQIIGRTRELKRVLHQVEQVASADCPVLISGETGTGKELIAQEIHRLSKRKDRVMVLVNCAALPAALVESELFGRERGAYTGALTSQVGRFEVANGSTIFLDEIGELSLEVQAKLLRVLQQGEFQKLGNPRTHKVDVRVLTATNRDLAEEVRKGRFREDLYYRLKVFPIDIPPLRQRMEDLPMLVFAFMEEFANRMGKKITKISRQTMDKLQAHTWPGNIRELRNVIEHSVILTNGDTLTVEILGEAPTRQSGAVTLAEAEREHILKTLEMTRWRIKGSHGAAMKLDVQPSTLYSRMQKLGIPHRRQKDEMSTNGADYRP